MLRNNWACHNAEMGLCIHAGSVNTIGSNNGIINSRGNVIAWVGDHAVNHLTVWSSLNVLHN